MSSAAVLKLEDAGFDRRQVEALIAFVDADRVTKADLMGTESRLDGRLARVEADVALLKWMVGLAVALNIALLVKLFVSP